MYVYTSLAQAHSFSPSPPPTDVKEHLDYPETQLAAPRSRWVGVGRGGLRVLPSPRGRGQLGRAPLMPPREHVWAYHTEAFGRATAG